jgi:hypothetical protein
MGRRSPDLTGQRFGRLLVVSRIEPLVRRAKWLTRCDCGAGHVAQGQYLMCGDTKSCGCMKREKIAAGLHLSHGANRVGARTPEYSSWTAMRRRCLDPDDAAYPDYGGRGIAICAEWSDFAAFLADMGQKPNGTSIDRIDNDSGYSAANCRWATPKQQAANRRARRWGKRPLDGKIRGPQCGIELAPGEGTADAIGHEPVGGLKSDDRASG